MKFLQGRVGGMKFLQGRATGTKCSQGVATSTKLLQGCGGGARAVPGLEPRVARLLRRGGRTLKRELGTIAVFVKCLGLCCEAGGKLRASLCCSCKACSRVRSG
jgi:hypothetical protein